MHRQIRKTDKIKLGTYRFLCLKVLASMYCVCFLERKGTVGLDVYRSRVSSFNVLNQSAKPIEIDMQILRKK